MFSRSLRLKWLFILSALVLLICGLCWRGKPVDASPAGGAPTATPAPGSLDPSFDGDGTVETSVATEDRGNAVVLQPDGKIVVGGRSRPGATYFDYAVARYNPDGSLDTTFNGGKFLTNPFPGFAVDDELYALAIQPDGKIVGVGSGRGTSGAFYRTTLVRYNTDGTLDAAFGANGFAVLDQAVDRAIVLQPDGKIICGGGGGDSQMADYKLARLNPDGSLDQTFGNGGIRIIDFGGSGDGVYGLALHPDGKIIAAGRSRNLGDDDNFAVARLLTDGSLDPSFGSGGKATADFADMTDLGFAVALQPDGRIVVSGRALAAVNTFDFGLVRFNTDGSIDTSFGNNGRVTTNFDTGVDTAFAVKIQPDGKIVAAGVSGGSATAFGLARYLPDGSLDAAFGNNGKVETFFESLDEAHGLQIQPDGKLVAAGVAKGGGVIGNFAVARYFGDSTAGGTPTATPTVTPTFTPTATPANTPLSYHVIDLGVLNTTTGQMISHPAGINQQGQVAGQSYSDTSLHAVRFDHGQITDLGTIPGGSVSTGVGINDLGHVVGDSQYSVNGGSIRHAVLFANGTAQNLGFLPSSGNYSRANGINSLDQVVGHSGPSLSTSNTRAFIWDAANGMRDIGTLGGAYAKAFSINNAGTVTGTAQGSSGNFRAFLWDEGLGMRDIGTLGGPASSGNFINADGHVTGSSYITLDNREHAFLYDGTMHDLGAIGNNDFFSDRSFGYGINIHDEVVGSTYRPYDGGALYQIPFIYRDGQMYDLETLVDESGADYRLYTATGINDRGEIAVDAFKRSSSQFHAVLLVPNGLASPTPTNTPTFTPTNTPTFTPTNTPTFTPTNTPTFTPTNTPTFTPTNTPTFTPTNTPTLTPTNTPTFTPTNTPTFTPTNTPTFTPTNTPTFTPTATPTATPMANGPVRFDYDGDRKADISVFRPSTGTWYIQGSQSGASGMLFGLGSDRIVPADYDGDGVTDIAVYRPSTGVWYIVNSSTGTVVYSVFGLAEDLPTPADYDGDGRADLSVYRPSAGIWYRENSSRGTFIARQFGTSEDKPAVGDYDGDGRSDIAVFRPSNGVWYWINSAANTFSGEQFGIAADRIVPADFDGDGRTDLAVYRPQTGYWHFRYSSTRGYSASPFGLTNDMPAPADLDGDGRADIAVFRPSDGNWYWIESSNGQFHAVHFGTDEDIPTPCAFLY